jgi:hypothetical protein
MMDDRISGLLRIVREEIDLYCDLIEHARRKTALLVQCRAEAILESNRTEELYSARLRTLELEMVHLCQDLGSSFRIPREELTLMKLADNFEQSLALEIKTQTTLFRNIVKQLKSINQRNMRLIERSIHYSRGVLALISNASGSYRHTGLFEPMPSMRPTFSQKA